MTLRNVGAPTIEIQFEGVTLNPKPCRDRVLAVIHHYISGVEVSLYDCTKDASGFVAGLAWARGFRIYFGGDQPIVHPGK